MDAAKKTATTPNHLFLTHVAAFRNGGKPTSGEVVTTKDRRYVLVNGKWSSRPYDGAKKVRDMDTAESQPTCKFVRDETLDGEAASVYGEIRRCDHNGLDFKKIGAAAAHGNRHRRWRRSRQRPIPNRASTTCTSSRRPLKYCASVTFAERLCVQRERMPNAARVLRSAPIEPQVPASIIKNTGLQNRSEGCRRTAPVVLPQCRCRIQLASNRQRRACFREAADMPVFVVISKPRLSGRVLK